MFDCKAGQGPDNSKIRKTILKFISVFHPDKQTEISIETDKKEEIKFKQIDLRKVAEEITKHLNRHLSRY